MVPRGWNFYFAARGYKEGENPGKTGSTRVVWRYPPENLFIVLKLFDDGGKYPKYPRTLKFWKTPDFKRDYMKWASSSNEFTPTGEEMNAYEGILSELIEDAERSLD